MNLFFRDYDARSPVTSGSQWLAAFTGRIALSFFVYSAPYTDIGRRLIVSAQQAWVLCFLLAAWFVLSIVPATAGVADVVNALLLAIGTLELLDRAKEIGTAGLDGLKLAYAATTDEELKAAGKAFAPALSGSVVTLIEGLVSFGAFKVAELAIVKRFPVPDWFKDSYKKAETSQSAKGERGSTETAATSVPKEPVAEPIESAPPEVPANRESPGPRQSKAQTGTIRKVAKVATGVVGLEGARKSSEVIAGDGFPTVALVLGGSALAVGVAALLLKAKS